MKVDFDVITQRWSVSLPEEPGRPVISADDRDTLLAFLEEHVTHELRNRRHKQLVNQGGL